MIICTYEDRPSDLIGLKLLICSIRKFCADVPIQVMCPVADDDLRAFIARQHNVRFDDDPAWRGLGWDVKPRLLTKLLEEGHDSVVWMDSDIIVARGFMHLVERDADTVVVTQEHSVNVRAVRDRTLGWGLQVGRSLAGINTGLVRVSQRHKPLLLAWMRLMERKEYQQAKLLPFQQRPAHLLTDQDVLVSLLGSTEFEYLKLVILRHGKEILHHFGAHGFSPAARLAALCRGIPPVIHSQGLKPWRFETIPSVLKEPDRFFDFLYLELSPYAHYARLYRAQVGHFPASLDIRTRLGKLCNVLSFGQPSLRGFGQALLAVSGKKVAKITRRFLRAGVKLFDLGRSGISARAGAAGGGKM